MEGNPHLLLEGMLLAGYATEATTGYIFIRGEYARVARILDAALEEARAAGYLGDGIQGSTFGFQIYTHLSAGRYMCGEASAMLNALEGKRANPRSRPPHMTGAGLWGRPTVVNNVETLCCAPPVIANGADWWLGLRRGEEGGSKIFGLSGRVQAAGLVGAPARHAHARGPRGARRRHAGRLPGARHHPRRRVHRLRDGGRLRRAARLRLHGEGRQPAGHGDDVRGRRQDLPVALAGQPRALLRPGVVRLVHALPRGSALGAQAAARHRGGPGRAGRPRRAPGDRLGQPAGAALLRPLAGRDPAARERPRRTSARTSRSTSGRGAAGTARAGRRRPARPRTSGSASPRRRRRERPRHRPHRRQCLPGRGRAQHARRRPLAGLRPALLLLAPRHGLRRRLPAVRRDADLDEPPRGGAARDRHGLHDRGRGGHHDLDRASRGARLPAQDDRAAHDQPPPRLSGVRRGRRVPPPGHDGHDRPQLPHASATASAPTRTRTWAPS